MTLVTHGAHGRPESYLGPVLREEFGDCVDWSYVEQCEYGGHVHRVQKVYSQASDMQDWGIPRGCESLLG